LTVLPIIRAFKALANLSVSQQPLGQMAQTQALRAPATPKEGIYQNKIKKCISYYQPRLAN
jgi:hypothetical protein